MEKRKIADTNTQIQEQKVRILEEERLRNCAGIKGLQQDLYQVKRSISSLSNENKELKHKLEHESNQYLHETEDLKDIIRCQATKLKESLGQCKLEYNKRVHLGSSAQATIDSLSNELRITNEVNQNVHQSYENDV